MIVKNKDQRVAVLVDVQNLYYSARNLYGSRISFKNLLKISLADRVLTRAIAYVIKSDVSEKENEFFSAVHDAGFELKEKDLQVFPGGAKKGDWDLGIAMDAIRLGQKVDSIVLVSGDGDYVPMVVYLQHALGCLVEVVAFDKTCAKSLKEIADDFIPIEKHLDMLLFKTEKSVRRGVVPRNGVAGSLRPGNGENRPDRDRERVGSGSRSSGSGSASPRSGQRTVGRSRSGIAGLFKKPSSPK